MYSTHTARLLLLFWDVEMGNEEDVSSVSPVLNVLCKDPMEVLGSERSSFVRLCFPEFFVP